MFSTALRKCAAVQTGYMRFRSISLRFADPSGKWCLMLPVLLVDGFESSGTGPLLSICKGEWKVQVKFPARHGSCGKRRAPAWCYARGVDDHTGS